MRGGRSGAYWLAPLAVLVTIAAASFVAALHPQGAAHAPVSDTLSAARMKAPPARPSPTPSLYEVLRAADLLARAGAIPPPPAEPSLMEVLQAADALAKAGLLAPPPSPTEVPLIEVLQAAVALKDAGVLPAAPPRDGAAPWGAPPIPERVVAPSPTPVPRPAAPPPPPAPMPDGWYDTRYTNDVRDLVNGERVRAGLPPVAVEPRLTSAAASYARVLSENNWFSHVGPDGSTLVSRVEAAGFPFDVPIGEILAWGTQSWPPADMVRAWMNSPTHRAEILSPVYTRAGVSCYLTPANGVTVRCVVDFAGG